MDPAALVGAIVEEVNCPICMTFLRKPVSIDCGHTFCHSCLSGFWDVPRQSQNCSYTCPLCRAPVKSKDLRPNWQLANVVDKVRLLGLYTEMGLQADMCLLHKEQLEMFCKEDGVMTCKVCCQCPEHEAHSVVPTKDVAWEYKWKLHEALEHLRKEQEEAWKLEVSEKERAANWTRQVETRKQSIIEEHKKYWQFLKEKELPGEQVEVAAAAALASLEQEQEKTKHQLELSHEKLIQQSQVLWRMIAELEERSQRPVRWMLQGIQDALNRSKSWSLQQPEHVSLELKTDCHVQGLREILKTYAGNRFWEIVVCSGRDSNHRDKWFSALDPSSNLTSPITENSVFLSESPPPHPPPCSAPVLPAGSFTLVNVRLDPDTAYSHLVVSKDRRSVYYGDTEQNLPDNPERFYRYNIVLGSQCISTGRHYWEVEVGDRSEWGLGVCEENVDRKEVVYLSPHYGFWVIRLRKGTEYRAGTDDYPLLPVSAPPHRVGVFLDYEAHDISFYSVTDGGSHIFTFPHSPFPGRLLPYFSPCYSIGTNNSSPLTICSLDGED